MKTACSKHISTCVCVYLYVCIRNYYITIDKCYDSTKTAILNQICPCIVQNPAFFRKQILHIVIKILIQNK